MKLEHKRVWVKGLVVDCTFGDSFVNCPAKEIRLLPIEERLDRVDAMPEEKLDEIIEYHKSCVEKKVGKKPDFYG